jgi:hypothetical protein
LALVELPERSPAAPPPARPHRGAAEILELHVAPVPRGDSWPTAQTSVGVDSNHQLSASMKWPPSPVKREPSCSSAYQLDAPSLPALTK